MLWVADHETQAVAVSRQSRSGWLSESVPQSDGELFGAMEAGFASQCRHGAGSCGGVLAGQGMYISPQLLFLNLFNFLGKVKALLIELLDHYNPPRLPPPRQSFVAPRYASRLCWFVDEWRRHGE